MVAVVKFDAQRGICVMLDLVSAGTLAAIVSAAVDSIDKVYRGYVDFVKKKDGEQAVHTAPPMFKYHDRPEEQAFVATWLSSGEDANKITYAELAQRLSPTDLHHIEALADSMDQYRKLWDDVQRQKPLAGLGLESARLDAQLEHLAKEISKLLQRILDFVQTAVGMPLDDHYLAAQDIATQYLRETEG